jgi:nucleotide-binding universal stress UspA family protein
MFPLKKIVCPTDFSEGSFRALAEASELALQFGAEIYLVHIIELLPPTTDPGLPSLQQELHEESEETLRKIAEPLTAKGVRTQTAIADGDAATEIVHMAQELAADLIVIATHGNTGWRHLAFGSVTEKVVRLATCPVLTIRMMSAKATNAPRAA